MTHLAVALLILNVFAPYVGSWLPPLAGAPAGGIIRDMAIVVFCTSTLLVLLKSKTLPFLQLAYMIMWLWFLAWIAILVATSGQIGVGILGARNLLLFSLVGLCTSINIQKGTLNYFSIKKCIYILGGIASVLGILDVATNGKVLTLFGYRDDYTGAGDLFNLVVKYLGFRRASGGLADSLNYGYTMSLFAVYFLYHAITTKQLSKSRVILSYLLVFLSSISVILSLTRGAIIVMVLGFIIFIFRYGSWRFKFASLIMCSVVILAIASSGYGKLLYGRFTDTERASAQSSQSRIDMALNSFDVIKQNPLGIGLGTQGAGTKFINDDMRVNTDNFFLWVMVESGIIGVFLLLATFMINYIICFKYALKNKTVFLLCAYMLIAYIITGMLSSAQISPLYSILYWVIINIEATKPAVPDIRTKSSPQLC